MQIFETVQEIFDELFGSRTALQPSKVNFVPKNDTRTKRQKRREAYLDSVLLDKIVDRLVKGHVYDDELANEVIDLEEGRVKKVQGFTETEIAERVKLRRKHKNL